MINARRRIDGVREAVRMNRDIVVLDDGFQHRALQRDFDLLLLSPVHLLPGRLLPAGPFRENWTAMRRASHILVTAKGEDEIEGAQRLADAVGRIAGAPPVDLFLLKPGTWTTLEGEPAPRPAGLPHLLTSVAQPEGFGEMVSREAGGFSGNFAFPDHHPYTKKDILQLASAVGGGWIATSEKDAVKLIAFRDLLPEVRVLPLRASPTEGAAERLMEAVETAIGMRGRG
jgi:tetraacyldisaccharide 4'-kinase